MSVLFAAACSVAAARDASAQAASYQPIRVDAGVSGTYASSISRGGVGAMIEPKFLVHNHVGVGLRLEGAAMWGGSFGDGGESVSMDMAAVSAIGAKGEYLFFDGAVRPFGGLGLGVYYIGSQSAAATAGGAAIDQKAGRYFGLAPQVGVDLGRVRLAATYNVIVGADIEVHQQIGNLEQSASYSQNYFTFELSFRLGGDRRAAPAPRVEPVAGR
jgi:hypothetical protein